jgi:hypothetical protein
MAPPEIKAAFGFNRSGVDRRRQRPLGARLEAWKRTLGRQKVDGTRVGREVTTPEKMLPVNCPTRSDGSEWLKEKSGQAVQKTE